MGRDYIEVNSFGKVFPKKGANARTPYEHQKNAMENLDIINKSNQYSTMIVLPTGGGKTYTASMWLLKNALNHKKKFYGLRTAKCFLTRRQNPFKSLHIQK